MMDAKVYVRLFMDKNRVPICNRSEAEKYVFSSDKQLCLYIQDKKAQLSLTHPRDASEKFARFT